MFFLRKLFLAALISSVLVANVWAGNPERIGQAGATQLLINPLSRSSGMNGMNLSFISGIESVITNPAGLGALVGTEVVFAHTDWLSGTDIRINNVGFGQSLGKGGAIGLNVMAFDFGDIQRTTIDNPDGGLGTFSPSFLNIGLTYAKEMVKNQIFVGATLKVVHEAIPDASASGVSFDAGVQYRDRNQRFRLGVALRNVGPTMRYSGDGLQLRSSLGNTGSSFTNSVSIVAADFELPTVLLIGVSYDFPIGATDSTSAMFRLTPTAQFNAMAYGYDQVGVGFEASFKEIVMLRFSQLLEIENNVFDSENSKNAFTGLAAGVSVDIPLGKGSRTKFGIDYSYRHTHWFNGTHTFGARLTL